MTQPTQEQPVAVEQDDEHGSDLVCGIVVTVLGGVILLQARSIADSSYANSALSPRDFPLLIGVLMLVAGLWMVGRAAWRRRLDRPSRAGVEPVRKPAADQDGGDAPASIGVLVLLLLVLFGYIQLLIPLGYVLATALFLGVVTTLLARRHLVRNVVFAAAFALAVYALFTYALNVQLPQGPLGGLI